MCIPSSALAATLYFSSPSSPTVGSNFQVSAYVGSTDMAMNAASGVISFSSDKLQVVSVSKTGSIFSLWAEEPSFSNSTGKINFEGIVLNPGFTGAQGKVITITFKAKSAGQASLIFSSGSVLANDGTGSNIFSGSKSTSFQIEAVKSKPVTPTVDKEPVETTPLPEQIDPPEPPLVVPYIEVIPVKTDSFLEKVINLFRGIVEKTSLLVLLITLVILIIGYIWYKIKNRQVKTTRRMDQIGKDVHYTFALLRGDLLEQLHLLEKAKTKRELTEEEKNLAEVIENHLVDAEKFIKKSINTMD